MARMGAADENQTQIDRGIIVLAKNHVCFVVSDSLSMTQEVF